MIRAPRSAAARNDEPRGSGVSIGLLGWVRTAALVALLALLAVRPLIAETFTRLDLAFLGSDVDALGPTPATTATLDWLTLLSSGVLLVASPVRMKWSIPLLSLALMLCGALLSCVAACEKREAVNAATNICVLLLAGAALVGARPPASLRAALLAGLMAGCAANAAKCYLQHFVEFPDLLATWEQKVKPQAMALGQDASDPTLVNYERRLRSGVTYGYLAHANVAATSMAMPLMALAGLLAAVLRSFARSHERPAAVLLCSALIAGVAGAIGLTGSLGAALAIAAAAAAAAWVAWRWRCAPAAWRRTAALLVACYAGAVAIGLGYGLLKQTLPHPSLAFRWQYWTAAAHAYADSPWLGIGRGDFADAYMRYKSPDSTEEVRDPHSLWVSLLVELGPLTLAGALLLGGWSLRRAVQRSSAETRDEAHEGARSAFFWVPAIATIGLHAGFSGLPLGNGAVAFLWLFEFVAIYLAAYALIGWLLNPAGGLAADWVRLGLAASLAVAAVHGLVDFGLLVPGGLSVLVMVVALARLSSDSAGSLTEPAREKRPKRAQFVVGLACIAALAAHTALVWRPTAAADRALSVMESAAARAGSPEGMQQLSRACDAVLRADDWDANAARQAAARLMAAATLQAPPAERPGWLDRAEQTASTAVERCRASCSAWRVLARVRELRAAALRDGGRAAEAPARLRSALDAWRSAARLYPTDPRLLRDVSAVCLQLWRLESERPLAQEAADDLARSLAIDDRREPGNASRLSASERGEMERWLRELSEAGVTPHTPDPSP